MQQSVAFFLGANTPRGFVSLIPHLAQEPGLRLSALKAGPGCGKSTFLRSVAAWEEPVRTELFYCSGDPDSLDGVLLHSRRLGVLDGTAPHVYDPPLPGASGDYLAAPPFLDPPGLAEKQPVLAEKKAVGASHYAQAYRLLEAAALVRQRMRGLVEPLLPRAALLRRAAGIAGRELPHSLATGKTGVLRKRFLDAMTPAGPMFLADTVKAMAPKLYLLEDRFDLGGFMLELWRDRALALGLEVYACCSLWAPETLQHLILPELGLAFVTEDGSRMSGAEPYRTLRLDACLPARELALHRGKLRLLRKLKTSLLEDAAEELGAARALHGEMEALYRPHLNIPGLQAMQQAFFAQYHPEQADT
jgi:hypothetical protein